MQYENPQPQEGINVGKRSPLIDFFVLVVGTFVAIAIITFVLSLLAGYIAKHIPFSVEQSFSAPFEEVDTYQETEKTIYLANLVKKIATCSDLPKEITIKFHYQPSDTVNAFATLGGNILIFQGLIDEVDNENQLAMIIAHEIAHVKNRHPIQAIGRAVVLGISLSLIFNNTPSNPLQNSGLLTVLSFNRSMESQADEDGLSALQRCYGHIQGAQAVFEKFEKMQLKQHNQPLPFLSTHPLNADRIASIQHLAEKNHWSITGKISQFPDGIKLK